MLIRIEEAQFVTTAEEQAAREMQRQTAELNAFISAWDMEDMPACPRGMALLKRFAEASPSGFEMARRSGLIDPLTLKHPLFKTKTKLGRNLSITVRTARTVTRPSSHVGRYMRRGDKQKIATRPRRMEHERRLQAVLLQSAYTV